MTDLERIKKDVVEMDSRANVCWYDTKVLTKAVRLILEELTADRKTENSSEKPNNSKVSEKPTGSADTQTYITEDRDTRILDAWQVKQMQDGKE